MSWIAMREIWSVRLPSSGVNKLRNILYVGRSRLSHKLIDPCMEWTPARRPTVLLWSIVRLERDLGGF